MEFTSPLVSVVVITYNSGEFVVDTLDSIANQTYENIELIISDDASSDDTVEICRDWIDKNWKRQTACKLVTTEINGGLPSNCNRGIKNSSGEWIKIIAGDDILLKDCIEKNINFCKNSGAEICFSKMDYIDNTGQPLPRDLQHDAQLERFFSKKFKDKKIAYLRNPLFLNVPTEFFSRELYDRCGGFDERIRLLEDQPFFYRILNKGVDLKYFDEVTVLYRKHGGSTVLKPKFVEDIKKSFNFYRKPALSKTITGKTICLLEEYMFDKRLKQHAKDSIFKFAGYLHYFLTKI